LYQVASVLFMSPAPAFIISAHQPVVSAARITLAMGR
jgi:hypothetical protein